MYHFLTLSVLLFIDSALQLIIIIISYISSSDRRFRGLVTLFKPTSFILFISLTCLLMYNKLHRTAQKQYFNAKMEEDSEKSYIIPNKCNAVI